MKHLKQIILHQLLDAAGFPPSCQGITGVGMYHLMRINRGTKIMLLQSRFSNSPYNDRQICLINYLKNKVHSGKCFLKSKYIARELGLSSKEVGTNMAILAETCPDFQIVKYSYSNSTTWLVCSSPA